MTRWGPANTHALPMVVLLVVAVLADWGSANARALPSWTADPISEWQRLHVSPTTEMLAPALPSRAASPIHEELAEPL